MIRLAPIVLLLLLAAGCDQAGSTGGGRPSSERPAPSVEPAAKPQPAASALPPLRIALIPIENPERLIENVKPAFAFIEQRIGRRIRHHVTLDYSAAVEALRAGRADVCFMPPLPYVLAHQQIGAVAVLGEIYAGRPYYHAKVFVRKDSGIKRLADLKGKTIAYVDPISSSGYLYPHQIFRKAGLLRAIESPEGGFFRRVMFAGGDQQAIQALYHKHVDAAGVGEFSLDLLGLDQRDAVHAIATSQRIPSHCVVVRKGTDSALREQFVKAMLALNEPAHKALLARLYGTEGYVVVTHETYRPVEALAREFGLLK